MSHTPKGWTKRGDKLLLVLQCSDFKHALAVFNSVADIAEKLQHHPDIGIKNYNELIISTTTHSVNGLTQKDYALAAEVNSLLDYQARKVRTESHGRD